MDCAFGTRSTIGGGKFENGAVTAAFETLFNKFAHAASKRAQQQNQTSANATATTGSANGTATVYVWDYRGKDVAWGHASMELDDGTYISFWPGGNREPSKLSDSIYTAEEIPNQTHADVIRLEGQAPDHTIQVTGIDTAAVKQWWGQWQADKQWSTFTSNCSTTVYQALRAGGKPYSFQIIWKPNDVLEYTNNVKNK